MSHAGRSLQDDIQVFILDQAKTRELAQQYVCLEIEPEHMVNSQTQIPLPRWGFTPSLGQNGIISD